MKIIEINTWKRRAHFKHFQGYAIPQYGATVSVKVGPLLSHSKRNNISFFLCSVYALTRATNMVPELKMRIRRRSDGNVEVVEHDYVHSSFTVLTPLETFNFCKVNYRERFSEYRREFEVNKKKAEENTELDLADSERDDVVYLSCLPWFSFSAVTQVMSTTPPDSIPRISWGKYEKKGNDYWMPVSIYVNHCLVDGFHLGTFYSALEEIINHPSDDHFIG